MLTKRLLTLLPLVPLLACDVMLRTTEYFWNGGRGPGWLRKP